MTDFDLTPERTKLLETSGHILVLGGPGSGKTTIALIKAAREIESKSLKIHQRILFLSFARATIVRVTQLAGQLASIPDQKKIQIETYHGFAWNLLRSHGYLLNAKQPIRLLPPPEAASRLADIVDEKERLNEKSRLFEEDGLLHFDLFAKKTCELLSKSKTLARIVSDAYPVVILDEFQDTNADEWLMIRELGKRSRLIALADAEQRIYEFRGADPRRIGEFVSEFKPAQFDFGVENNRSSGKDIIAFGNDLLSGNNLTKTYNDVKIVYYEARKGSLTHLELKLAILAASKKLRELNKPDWSLAILVPTKQLMLDVSACLATEQKFASGKHLGIVPHDVAFDASGPSLAANLIGRLLDGGDSVQIIVENFINDLCSHIRGRKGDDITAQAQLELALALSNHITTGIIPRGATRKNTIVECRRIANERISMQFTGDPSQDWLSIRNLLSASSSESINKVAEDAKYLRLLHRGAIFRSQLSELWRKNGTYLGATSSVRNALTQEHFSASVRDYKGIQVMTIHKSKGKEFDHVIIYEGNYQGRIVPSNAKEKRISQARLILRVGVTRAKDKVTIFTPKADPCSFL